ncbi:hypothetical protein B9Z46_08965 [Limnohabitans sp. Hippo4]|nr:hypothetical protein B9Z46_08965 [Limnohabitans sp. Hippo4]
MVSMFGLFCVFTDTGDCWNSKSYTLIVLKLRFQKNPDINPACERGEASPIPLDLVIFFFSDFFGRLLGDNKCVAD